MTPAVRRLRIQRALERGSLTSILEAAAELDRIGLNDALAVCAAVAREEPAEFDRYAVRWIATAIREWESQTLPRSSVPLGP